MTNRDDSQDSKFSRELGERLSKWAVIAASIGESSEVATAFLATGVHVSTGCLGPAITAKWLRDIADEIDKDNPMN